MPIIVCLFMLSRSGEVAKVVYVLAKVLVYSLVKFKFKLIVGVPTTTKEQQQIINLNSKSLQKY